MEFLENYVVHNPRIPEDDLNTFLSRPDMIIYDFLGLFTSLSDIQELDRTHKLLTLKDKTFITQDKQIKTLLSETKSNLNSFNLTESDIDLVRDIINDLENST